MEIVKVKIINRSNNALPSYSTEDSAGMDLRAWLQEPMVLEPMQRALVPTGISIELPHGYECQLRPRSGLALKKGITLLNTPGTIDADYRGEVGVILINLPDGGNQLHEGGMGGNRYARDHHPRRGRLWSHRSEVKQ